MNIKNVLGNFLYDKSYAISFFNDSIYIYNYEKICYLSRFIINIKFANFSIKINGSDLSVDRMLKTELIITGTINNVEFLYDEC